MKNLLEWICMWWELRNHPPPPTPILVCWGWKLRAEEALLPGVIGCAHLPGDQDTGSQPLYSSWPTSHPKPCPLHTRYSEVQKGHDSLKTWSRNYKLAPHLHSDQGFMKLCSCFQCRKSKRVLKLPGLLCVPWNHTFTLSDQKQQKQKPRAANHPAT